MESQKSSESTSSSSGEVPERANAKTEKTHQKITLPTFEKRGIQEAKLWRRRFTQYIKMTQNIDLNEMTTDRELLPNYRDDLEHRIKDLFIWALGESAITEMTRTVRDNDPNKMDINQLYSLFRLHFIPERNKFHSRGDFFGITREKYENERRNELYRVIEKIRNLPQKQEKQLETSSETQEQEDSPEVETESTSSIESLGVPAINFKKYIGATGVRYFQMGQASHIQEENKWDLEETIRQAEQKFATDLRTIAKETTDDEKLLKTLVCIERRTLEQIPEEYKAYQRQLSTRFGVVFYDDRIIIPKSLRTTIIMLLHKGHAAINKMTAAAKPFWWPRLIRDIQQKCDECIPCKMAGKNIKPQLPMTEINYLPPAEKTNQEIQLDFIGPIRFKHRRFYILLSIDRYSRWPAACICETPTGKTAKNFLEQYITLNGLPQTIRTDKGTAFTGKEFRDFCKSLNIKLIYGTPYIHTPTGLVERGIKTLKEYLRTNLEEGYVINEALSRSLNVMRMTIHSSIKETPFERHYGRKPRTEIHNYLNVSPNKQYNVSARPETLQV